MKPEVASTRRLKWAQILRFGAVGSVGFLVDGGLMQLLFDMTDMSPLLARGISFPVAVTVTWLLNRYWTFQHGSSRRGRTQYACYFAVQLAGFTVNYGSFALLVQSEDFWGTWPLAALAVGSLIAMFFTYVLSSVFVFGPERADLGAR